VSRNTSEFEGAVRAYFSRAEENQKDKAVDSAVRAKEGTLIQDEKLPFGQKLTLRKEVMFDRKTYSARAEMAEVFGPGAELVKARDTVVLINREENTTSYGDIFEWVKANGKMALSAKKTSQTRTILHNKKSEPTIEITAASVTRATTIARPQARGKVRIVQFAKDKTAPPVRMGAEWAEMVREQKIIQLNGSPYVEGEMGKIGAREIILHYEEQRYEMLGILPGIVEKRINE
jgi:lipopolysaccharide export system protein LptA